MNRVTTTGDILPIRHVLMSAWDKRGIPQLAAELSQLFPDALFYSTGGTYRTVSEVLPSERLIAVSRYTGQPEIAGGLVKTLDYKLYLGLLSERSNPDHEADRGRLGAVLFDLVVCNLYPFEAVVSQPGSDLEDARGNIDIGGPTMVRAAAKNFLQVACLTDHEEYSEFLAEVRASGGSSLAYRYRLAVRAFERIARYDRRIADYLTTHGLPADLYSEEPDHG